MALFNTGIALLALAGCTPDPVLADDTAVMDGPGEAFAVISEDYLPTAIEIIGDAQDHVHVIEYVIYEGAHVDDLLDALTEAAARGVEVKLLADEVGSGTMDALARLQNGGVDARLDSPSTTTHNKLIIADDATLVGSHNMTTPAMSVNNEASVLVRDVEVSAWYDAYFQALWDDSDRSPDVDKPTDTHIIPLGNREIPDYLLDCLGTAQDRVRIVLYAFSYSSQYPDGDLADLATALEDTHARGVDVQIILDGSDWMVDNNINRETITRLQASGLDLRVTASDVVTHAKVLVCDDVAVVGDANWSYSAFEYYNGTSVRVDDSVMAQDFVDWAAMLWDDATEPVLRR